MSVQLMGEMEKYLCPNFLQRSLENIDTRSCSNGTRDLIRVLYNPHRKGRHSPLAVARSLEILDTYLKHTFSKGKGHPVAMKM